MKTTIGPKALRLVTFEVTEEEAAHIAAWLEFEIHTANVQRNNYSHRPLIGEMQTTFENVARGDV